MKNKILAVLLSFLALTPAVLLADSAQDYSDMGQALSQRGLYAKAIGYFQQAVAANPSDWQSYQYMGDAYMKMNANAEALGAYQKSLQINPNNPEVQSQVNSLTASGVQPIAPSGAPVASAPSNSPGGNFGESQPVTETETVVVKRRRPFRRQEEVVNYNDNLAPMDHAKFWTTVSLGYTNSRGGDLTTSANSWNSDINGGNYGLTGSALFSNDGLNLGFELGFLINPNNGIGIGVKYVNISDYNLNVNYNNAGSSGSTVIGTTSYNSDYDQTTLSPYIIPITIDYFLFLPDHDGRFYLSLGAGYYFADIHVNRNYSSVIQSYLGGDPNYANEADQYSGDLTAGAPGFQVGIGRDFAISRNFSLSLFAEGRYVKLTNFTGTITDINGNTANVGLAYENSITGAGNDPGVFVEDTTAIGGANNNKYATVDFTGFDVGVALNFYSL